MLQSFIGTIDKTGLRSFRVEDDSEVALTRRQGELAFWAVLDNSTLACVHSYLRQGQRTMAAQVITDQSAWMGWSQVQPVG